MLDPSHVVYNIKNVASIPLVEDRARTVLNALASQNLAAQRQSLLPKSLGLDLRTPIEDSSLNKTEKTLQPGPKVRFTQESGRDGGHIRASSSPHSSISDLSAETHPSSPVLDAIAPRLTFWNKLAKPAQSLTQTLLPSSLKGKETKRETDISASAPLLDDESEYVGQEAGELERLIYEKKEEPAEVLKNILTAFSSQPASPEERHAVLDTKIVRECVRIYAKGEMYVAYTFGTALFTAYMLSSF